MSEHGSFHRDFFKLPEGARLVRGIFTTMSMDMEELIRMAGMCLIPGCPSIDSVGLSTLKMMAEKNRLRFFYDGRDPFNLRCGPAAGFRFRDLAVPVISDAPCFHPKIILLEYAADSGPRRFRLLVSSKNLTAAQSFETGVWLESVPHRGVGRPNHNLSALAEFLRNNTKDAGAEDVLSGVGDALDKVDFVLREDRDDPSRSAGVTVKVSGPGGLGRQEALAKRLLDGMGRRFRRNEDMIILSPDYETSGDAAKILTLVKPKKEDGTDLPTHGKLYYDRAEKILWTGSANCSLNGLTQNVECMAEVREAEDVWEDGGAGAGRLFGVPCVQYTEARPLEDSELGELKDALRIFLESHTVEMLENRREYPTVKITVRPKGQGGYDPNITIKLLPLGMPESNSETSAESEKWKEFPGDAGLGGEGWSPRTFIGRKGDPLTHALRIKAERDSRTCEAVYWDWRPASEEERRAVTEEAFRAFINTPWLQQYCRVGEDGPEALHRQIIAVAAALLQDERADGENTARRKRIGQITAASSLYCGHFSGRGEEK